MEINQINRNISINNSFGKNINIKKIPSETINNINDNISQQKANTPIIVFYVNIIYLYKYLLFIFII